MCECLKLSLKLFQMEGLSPMEGQQPGLKPVCGLRRLRDVQVGHEGGGEEVCLLCYREGGCGKLHRAGGVHHSGEN